MDITRELLLKSGCTEKEADEHIKNGAFYFETLNDYIESLDRPDTEEIEEITNAYNNNNNIVVENGLQIVTYQGHKYILCICL